MGINSDAMLRFWARRNAYVWELVGGGPQGQRELVELNPQPLPPLPAGMAIVALLAERAIVAGSYERFAEEIDEWCGTGQVPHIPVPKGGGPFPDPWSVFLGGAIAAVELAHGLEDDDAKQVSGAAQRLFDRAQQADG